MNLAEYHAEQAKYANREQVCFWSKKNGYYDDGFRVSIEGIPCKRYRKPGKTTLSLIRK